MLVEYSNGQAPKMFNESGRALELIIHKIWTLTNRDDAYMDKHALKQAQTCFKHFLDSLKL
ncbi:hypothetical protein SY83_03605 [Paenibacillus swuensis]|uniref:Uncharacterized protein n=1 Tax=Paenibacillus swuensis TaxID=1178515 RepID=A0A172TEQ4_9BACL|nr:hypothetical protein SY83_03605 [Paenibacillus swuensis]